METLSIDLLTKNISFTGDLLIDSSFLLLPKGALISESLVNALKAWNYDSVLCDGNISLGGEIEVKQEDEIIEPAASKETIGLNVKKAIENSIENLIDNSDQARLQMVQSVYDEYMNYIEQIFTHYTTHKEISQDEMSETVQQLCIFIKENRRYILRINPTTDTCQKNFIVIHAMRTTVLAIAIALQLHMPLSKMIELGITSIIHEIGMLRLPPQLYMSTKKLTPSQRAHISKHTVFGYTIVKDLGFPLSIQLGVLEHHEKENGTGYPRRLTGENIIPNAKIISVACSYEAISSPRTYKDERSTFDALLEMIQNKNKQYDDSVLKALLYTVSLYPIGTYVYLSNRKVAVVVDSNQKNPKCPVVQYLTEREQDGSPKVTQTDQDISILRILTKREKDDIIKIVEEKYSNIEAAKKTITSPQEKNTNTTPDSAASKPETKASPVISNKDNIETEEVDISIFS